MVGGGGGTRGGREYMDGSWSINKDTQLTHMQAEYVMKIRFLVMHCSLKSKTMNKLKRARGKQQVSLAVYWFLCGLW